MSPEDVAFIARQQLDAIFSAGTPLHPAVRHELLMRAYRRHEKEVRGGGPP